MEASMDLDMDNDFDGPFRARSNTWPLPRPDIPGSFTIKSEINVDDDLNDVIGTGVDGIHCNGGGSMDGTFGDNCIPTVANEIGPCLDGSGSPLSGGSSGGGGNCATNNGLNGPGGGNNGTSTPNGGPKKNSSRRNAWGNMSYADLITQAIQSSPEKRLTLSQIYDWMVQNVPYFKDKGDSNSSAGWKNSIRHNLSLHNRFKRVQNEGTGKSSWWVINPEAKPGKAARRRATSMETQKYEKKRGRVKKKVEALRNGTILDDTPSPGSSVSEGLDMFPESPLHHSFQLSPDFRPRASSNASSCGRLSPIPVESDMHDSHVPPMSPLSAWNSDIRMYSTSDVPDTYTEKLVEMATTLKLGGKSYLNVTKSSPSQQQQCGPPSISPTSNVNSVTKSYTSSNNFASQATTNNNNTSYNNPSVNSHNNNNNSNTTNNNNNNNNTINTSTTTTINNNNNNNSNNNNGTNTLTRNGSDPYFQQTSAQVVEPNNITLTSLTTINGTRSPTKMINSEAIGTSANSSFNSTTMSPSPSQSLEALTGQSQIVTTSLNSFTPSKASQVQQQQQRQQQQQQAATNGLNQIASQNRGFVSSGLDNNAILRLNSNTKLLNSLSLNGNGNNGPTINNNNNSSSLTSLGATASQVMGHILSLNNALPNDLDLNLDSLQGGLECDVDQVIRHELSVDGNLDFLDSMHHHGTSSAASSAQTSMTNASSSVPPPPPTASAVSSHSWVH